MRRPCPGDLQEEKEEERIGEHEAVQEGEVMEEEEGGEGRKKVAWLGPKPRFHFPGPAMIPTRLLGD
ncbi:hypothetical protein E2C01_064803 [Portunus trituberculatus]|uniref:Uncharacterized protein n=1 Tax=Portunus trituberculatus TaxID=210409 RepID=A0A5B7HCS7_PORTR|nr:hypothetical protein [Portunus trituberculatus]